MGEREIDRSRERKREREIENEREERAGWKRPCYVTVTSLMAGLHCNIWALDTLSELRVLGQRF